MCSSFQIPCHLEDVFGGLRIKSQCWLRLVTQIIQQRHNSFRLRRSQCRRAQLCFCTTLCDDILLVRVCFQGMIAEQYSRLLLMIFEFPCNLPVRTCKCSDLFDQSCERRRFSHSTKPATAAGIDAGDPRFRLQSVRKSRTTLRQAQEAATRQ